MFREHDISLNFPIVINSKHSFRLQKPPSTIRALRIHRNDLSGLINYCIFPFLLAVNVVIGVCIGSYFLTNIWEFQVKCLALLLLQ